jgi:acetyltransferase-like isoleucine patch superfamily enzyme
MIKKIVSVLGFLLPSIVTGFLFKLVGHRIGKNTHLCIFSYIYADEIDIGNDVDIRPFVFIRVKKLVIGSSSIISYGTQIKGDHQFITKGNNFIGVHCLINCEESVSMGFYSGFGPRCTIYTHGSFLPISMGYPAKIEAVFLDDYVWVAMSVTILPGTHIEPNCIINPGVVLKSRVPSNSLMEVKSNVFSTTSVSRLQAILQNTGTGRSFNIIEDFLTYYQIDHQHDKTNRHFLVENSYTFKYSNENDIIELWHGNRKITYDLKNFDVDPSKLKLHKKFVFFLRRRCGIILRTRYGH